MTRCLLLLSLTTCTYRYETGSFVNDLHQHSQSYLTVPTSEAVSCKESTSTIKVVNTLNHSENTITTVASSTHSNIDSCFE
jgi:hypothetical protein